MAVSNIEAERYVLGCVMLDNTVFEDLGLRAEQFSDSTNMLIYRAMEELRKDGKPVGVADIVLKLGTDVANIGIDYIADLGSIVSSVMNWRNYRDIVQECWKLRRAQQIANGILRDIPNAQDAGPITHAITELSKLEEATYSEDFNIRDTLDDLLSDMMNDDGSLHGMDTGFESINKMLGGLQDGDLIIVGARPSVGKTAFALNIGDKTASMDVVTSVFSLEMSEKSLLKRMVSARGFVDSEKMRNPKTNFTKEDWSKTTETMSKMREFPLFIFDKPSVTVQEIRAKVRSLKKRFPNKKHVCIIDYLQLIQGHGGANRAAELGEISRALKLMAREFEMPVIALSQLSRSVESRPDKHPMLSDLRDSGNIEQDADVIAFLYRDDYYDPNSEKKNVIEINIAKQRNGRTGKIELAFLKAFNKFVELSKH